MSGTDGEPEDAEVTFTDQPGRPAADQESESEERTAPGEGSTGPTGVREDLGTLAEEGRKLLSAVESRFVGPLLQSYPEVARHLGAAGREVLAAYRSAVHGQEQAWRDQPNPDRQQEKITVERVDSVEPPGSGTTED